MTRKGKKTQFIFIWNNEKKVFSNKRCTQTSIGVYFHQLHKEYDVLDKFYKVK